MFDTFLAFWTRWTLDLCYVLDSETLDQKWFTPSVICLTKCTFLGSDTLPKC